MTTEKERVDKLHEEHRQWQLAIKDALGPLLALPNKPGLVVARVFYVMRSTDGVRSAGQAGITPLGEEDSAVRLVMSIPALLSDRDGNQRFSVHEVKPKE